MVRLARIEPATLDFGGQSLSAIRRTQSWCISGCLIGTHSECRLSSILAFVEVVACHVAALATIAAAGTLDQLQVPFDACQVRRHWFHTKQSDSSLLGFTHFLARLFAKRPSPLRLRHFQFLRGRLWLPRSVVWN